MSVTVTFSVEVYRCNGSISIEIFDKDQLIYSGDNFAPGPGQIEFCTSWPTTLNIITSNRGIDDTVVDNGAVVENKAIEITGIAINRFGIHQDLIDTLFHCYRDNQTTPSPGNFWDFNGKIQMHLTHSSPMRYLLSLQNQFDGNRLTWNDQ